MIPPDHEPQLLYKAPFSINGRESEGGVVEVKWPGAIGFIRVSTDSDKIEVSIKKDDTHENFLISDLVSNGMDEPTQFTFYVTKAVVLPAQYVIIYPGWGEPFRSLSLGIINTDTTAHNINFIDGKIFVKKGEIGFKITEPGIYEPAGGGDES